MEIHADENNPYADMLSGKSYLEVLAKLSPMSAEEQDQAAARVADNEIERIGTFTVTTCLTVGIQHTLIVGAFLKLFLRLVNRDGYRELFTNLLNDLDLCRSQGYRCIAVWECFGGTFLQETALHRYFCVESLKILSEERTPAAAREEAIQLARQHEKITMKRAWALQEKHAPEKISRPPSIPAASRSTAATRRWAYAGSVVKIQLTSVGPSGVPDVSAIIADLEAAIAALRNGTQAPRLN